MRVSALTMEIPEHVQRLRSLGDAQLSDLSGAPRVVISAIGFEQINGYEGTRFAACLKAGIPQIVMVDPRSHYQVPARLAERGAITVPAPRPGLATPYLDAAQLVRLHAGPKACTVKAEGDKLLKEKEINQITTELRSSAVVIGDRTRRSMESMSAAQQETESLIDPIIAELLNIPHGASSGVLAFTQQGLNVFLEYEQLIGHSAADWNNWKYLVHTPALAQHYGLVVGSVRLDLIYDKAMVAAENASDAIALKRLQQLPVMLEGAFQVRTLVNQQASDYCPPSAERLAEAGRLWTRLRKAVAG